MHAHPAEVHPDLFHPFPLLNGPCPAPITPDPAGSRDTGAAPQRAPGGHSSKSVVISPDIFDRITMLIVLSDENTQPLFQKVF